MFRNRFVSLAFKILFLVNLGLLAVACGSSTSSPTNVVDTTSTEPPQIATPTPSRSNEAPTSEETPTSTPILIPTSTATPTVTPIPVSTPTSTTTPLPRKLFSSNVTRDRFIYDGKTIEITGQTFLTDNPASLLIDGESGVNISGDTADLQPGFYRLEGIYDADTNTLNVTQSIEEQQRYLPIEAAKELGIKLVPVSVEGLIATMPKEVAATLTSYLSIPKFPQDVVIYPYVVYAKNGLYLALSDTPVHLPVEVSFRYEGTDHSFTFSGGEVKGILVKTPFEQISFGPKWQPNEFGGVIIAESIRPFEPVRATVGQVSNDPESFAFKRVSIAGSYLVATATIDYSEVKVPFGVGILADTPIDLFFEERGPRLKTIDPERNVWQLRQGRVIGTVLYPTEEVLKYLDYSAPLTGQTVREMVKPALIVDTLQDDAVDLADVSELNPLSGNPRQYWGKVVEFEGYAFGANIPLKDVAEAVSQTEIPINVNMLAMGIADSPTIGSQLAVVGLNNELLDEGGEAISGRFKFRVAVTEMPVKLVDVGSADTALFLLSREELPDEIPTEHYSLSIATSPSGTGLVTIVPPGGSYLSGTMVTLTAVPGPGYTFDHWSGDVSGSSPITTITVDSDKTATVHFKSTTYSLNVSVDPSGTGSVTLTPPGGNYASGTLVTLTAVPGPGYTFDRWSGAVSGSSPITTITLDSDKTATAHFKPITYSLNVSVDPPGAGSVTLTPLGGNYASGTLVTLIAVPGPGFTFERWSGDASGHSPITTITVDSDKTVTAHLKPITYSLNVSVDPPGAGSVTLTPLGGNYASGTLVTLIAVLGSGYTFDRWSGDVSGSSPITTATLDSEKSLTAHFKTIF